MTRPAVLAPRGVERLWLVVAYLGPLSLWPLVREVPHPQIRWHARHGLVLFLVELVGGAAFLTLAAVVSYLVGPAALVFAFLVASLALGLAVLHGALVLAALEGESWRIPGVTHLVERF